MQKIASLVGGLTILVLFTGVLIATAAWQEPTDIINPALTSPVQAPTIPSPFGVDDYKPLHSLPIPQVKNYPYNPLNPNTLSIGALAPIVSSSMASMGGGYVPLASGNYSVSVGLFDYIFPEATYVKGMKKDVGNIDVASRPVQDFPSAGTTTYIPGFLKADVSTNPSYASRADMLYLEGGTQTGLPATAPENDMVNILLKNYAFNTSTTNRFGIEKTAGNAFASLRMGDLFADRAFVGGSTSSPSTNFIGNFTTLPDSTLIANSPSLAGTITGSNVNFSNIGYGDYCYLQNPQFGGKCPTGFYLTKYDGYKEAICRSINPSAHPTAVDVPNDYRRDPHGYSDVLYAVNNTDKNTDCLATPPTFICSDGLDNDNDGKTDYPNDPGCTAATDNSEKDPPPTPPGAALVTAQLKGPYLGNSCSNGVPIGDPLDADKTYWITFADKAPASVTTGYPPSAAQIATTSSSSYLFHVVDNIQYIASNPKIPEVGDTIISNGKYNQSILSGFTQYVRVGSIPPGWYFITNSTGQKFKVKVNASVKSIIGVKPC